MNREDLLVIAGEHVEHDQVVEGTLPDGTPYRGRLQYRIDRSRVTLIFETDDSFNQSEFELI